MIDAPVPRISVIICSRDRYDHLEPCIRSVMRQKIDTSHLEIVVVDNSTNCESAELFAQKYSGIENLRYLIEPTPGLSNARNKGVELAKAGIVAFIDDDATAEPSWAENLLLAFTVFPDTGCVGGTVIPNWEVQRPNWLHEHLLGYLTIIDRGGLIREAKGDEWFAGCNIAFDKAALQKVGGFTQSLGRTGNAFVLLSNEEIEVCNKLKTAGFRRVYAPGAVVKHVVTANRVTKDWMRRRVSWQAVSDMIVDPEGSVKRARNIKKKSFLRFSFASADHFLHEMDDRWANIVLSLSGE